MVLDNTDSPDQKQCDIFNSGFHCCDCGWQGEGLDNKTDIASRFATDLGKNRIVESRDVADLLLNLTRPTPGSSQRKRTSGSIDQLIIDPDKTRFGGIHLRCPNCRNTLLFVYFRNITCEPSSNLALIKA